MKPKSTLRAFLLGCSSLLVASSLPAASLYWDGTDTGADADGGDGTWDNLTTSNWDEAATSGVDTPWTNANNDTAVFGGATGAVTIDAGGVTVGGLQFDTAGYTLSGGVLTFGAAGSITANENATISSELAGSAAIEKSGAGSLTLSGINTSLSSPWTLSAGTLIIDNADSLGTGSVSVTGSSSINATGSLTYTNDIDVGAALTLKNLTTSANTAEFSGVLSGSDTINLANSGSGNTQTNLFFSNENNTFTGNVVGPAGNANGADYFRFNSIGDGGNFTFNKGGNRGGVTYAGSSDITFDTRQIAIGTSFNNETNGNNIPINAFQNIGTGTVTFNTDLTPGAVTGSGSFFFDGTNTGGNTFTGTISNPTSGGNLGIGKWGTGKWILSGDNTYLGNVIVGNGTLSVDTINVAANAQPLGQGSLIRLGDRGNSGTLEFTGSIASTTDKQILMGTTVNNGGHTGSGTILNNGAGSLTFSNSTLNQAVATTTASRSLTLGGSNTGDNEIQGVIQNNAAGTIALTKTGAGIWKLSGANTYTGVTNVAGGVLLLNNADALPGGIGATGGTGAFTFNSGGVLGLANGDFERPSGNGTTAGAFFMESNGGWAAYGADRIVNVGGANELVAWGSGTGAHSWNGKTVILGHSTATHKVTVANPINLAAGASRPIRVDDGAAPVDGELSGVIQDFDLGGGISKSGTGTLLLSNDNTYTGNTVVTAGTVTLSGSLASAKVTISSGATVNGTGSLTFNIDGITADQVVANGTIDISGLTVAVNATGSGLDQTEYVLVDATGGGSISGGTFAGLTGASGYALDYGTANQVKLVQVGGGANYASWATDKGINGEPFDGDFNSDGITNGVAYALGLSPTASSQPAGVLSGNTITFTKGDDAITNADVSWIIETSETLEAESWTEEVIQSAGDPGLTISYTFAPGPGTPKKFARMKAAFVPADIE